ncbi:hypothetical protein [Streptomyces sp. LaBMicrA B280]|uniref:hypothetical protein n=1 Tax=Streptomyces sp. LaBMicrA B280 TaxID=3391001 RepID=UPI003BA4B45F
MFWPSAAKKAGHAHLSVFRFDDGMFDRFASHVEELWTQGTPVWEGEADGQA